ncbi:MAG TPA: 2-amino-4-hydroxy-6-hydroxymethyldihydropteridine diphosphokinase [Arenimonas sp.]|nr:2-amino-4-hydroxy-6-hydroxymethyldihydropteridine diphosphokinase [Arenimonas sp.]HPO23792.1 2-amino-4-hydroxy-6-hydroxymethyldihydropteridine diphosphokinase [Arenimonas sp.]
MINESRRVFIGFGGNMGDVEATLMEALFAIDEIPQTTLRRQSAIYRTPAWGNTDQADFLNGVAELQTRLTPNILLQKLLEIEERFGRIRQQDERWQPRTLDLDILLFGDDVINEANLRVPHPHMHERAFVLVPLAELVNDLEIPGQGSLKDCLAKLDISDIKILE